jgi:hypothetical protein
MKTKSGARRMMTTAEAAAREGELKPIFLEDLTPREVAAVLAAARLRRLRANSVVAREGQSADEVFLLLDGQARHFVKGKRSSSCGSCREMSLAVEHCSRRDLCLIC